MPQVGRTGHLIMSPELAEHVDGAFYHEGWRCRPRVWRCTTVFAHEEYL